MRPPFIHPLLLISAIIVAALPIIALGESKAVLNGPEKVEPGDLAVIDGSKSVGDNIKFLIDDSLSGRTFQFEKQVIFATRTPGKYRIQVITADKEAMIDVASIVVTVGDPQPEPPPKPPVPPTPPVPPLPPVNVDPAMAATLQSGFAGNKQDAAIWSGLLLGMARVIEQDQNKPSGARIKTMSDIERLRNLVVSSPSRPVSGGDVIGRALAGPISAVGGAGDQVDQNGRRVSVAKIYLGAATVLDEVSRQ